MSLHSLSFLYSKRVELEEKEHFKKKELTQHVDQVPLKVQCKIYWGNTNLHASLLLSNGEEDAEPWVQFSATKHQV